ncbi:hypothetical protein [Myceligenerans pegani]|uniref:Uncharacterized protein n=1 Tax=Myceligenerans pegani TaxID=2776917 RepID=A0ABR9N2K7_9MICO|nr:hypothetical protein [Myceligenerans sp. TRM 65318]MBE1877461.1 hypothetical protein [Myceligenerans sp. TRM 65318]MBE3019732.1 hypothetical protein [Myceligenerans sp. TRM 65318]
MTPEWARYIATHPAAGPAALPPSTIPTYQTRANLEPVQDGGTDHSRSVRLPVAWTPSTLLILWMFRRPNRAWGMPVAALASTFYALCVMLFEHATSGNDIYILGMLWGLWNMTKFAIAGPLSVIALVVGRLIERQRTYLKRRSARYV